MGESESVHREASREGLVVRIEPRVWTVEVDGRDVPCSLRPRLFDDLGDERSPVAVGDRVRVALEGARGTIDERLPRRNRFARPTPSDPRYVQVTAANIDLLVIVVATKDPPLREGLIDRFLVAAERNDMDAMIVVNKCDEGARDEIAARLAIYGTMGYAVLYTSAAKADGIAGLEDALKDRTSLFTGHSGVGKSSLLNAIDSRLTLRTGTVAKHGRGRHTTTSVSLVKLPKGGHVVDSPGIRGFGLFGIPKSELALLMPDIRPFATGCHFPDCSHDHEPRCSVRIAATEGRITAARYDSYRRMLKTLDGAAPDDDFSDS
jgi:ribosome biogenesis GTPase